MYIIDKLGCSTITFEVALYTASASLFCLTKIYSSNHHIKKISEHFHISNLL